MRVRRSRNTYVYKMVNRNGRVTKYGTTNSPRRRASENRRAGLGSKLKVMSPKLTRESAVRRERGLINSYRNRFGQKPPGNKK